MLNLLLKKKVYPIGIELDDGFLRMAQIAFDGRGLFLAAAGCEPKPDDIEVGTGRWQRWAAEAAKRVFQCGNFKGKQVVTAMPCDDVFIYQIKMPKLSADKTKEAIFKKLEKTFPFDPANTIMEYVVADMPSQTPNDSDMLVMAVDREKVDRYMAIYEQAGLEIQSICVWPMVMMNSHVRFFSRREEDTNTTVMLLGIGTNHSNVAICRYDNLLFARVIPIGSQHFDQSTMVQRLHTEVDACRRYFESISGTEHVQRLIFLSGRSVDNNICEKVAQLAKHMQIPAQIGDVLAAVNVTDGYRLGVDRRNSKLNWAMAFGLSLTG